MIITTKIIVITIICLFPLDPTSNAEWEVRAAQDLLIYCPGVTDDSSAMKCRFLVLNLSITKNKCYIVKSRENYQLK